MRELSSRLLVAGGNPFAAPASRKERKILCSSLARSLFTGTIISPRCDAGPLFRMEKRSVLEVKEGSLDASGAGYVSPIDGYLDQQCQWIITASDGGIALRNIDHLIPVAEEEGISQSSVDLYYTEYEDERQLISPDFWAVTPSHFETVRKQWMEIAAVAKDPLSMDNVWTDFIRNLPLKKRRFETGEVFAPRIGTFDAWKAANAAFVVLKKWPDKERWMFLQSLYYGTYYGDTSGLMLDILDP